MLCCFVDCFCCGFVCVIGDWLGVLGGFVVVWSWLCLLVGCVWLLVYIVV